MIFQEPMTSLSPVHTIGDQIVEAIRLHQQIDRAPRPRERALELLRQVDIPNPERAIDALHVRALRRHAPARHDRHGAGLQSRRC